MLRPVHRGPEHRRDQDHRLGRDHLGVQEWHLQRIDFAVGAPQLGGQVAVAVPQPRADMGQGAGVRAVVMAPDKARGVGHDPHHAVQHPFGQRTQGRVPGL